MMRFILSALGMTAAAAMLLLGAGIATAQPPIVPGCGYGPSQYPWYNPCSGQAPWNSSNWVGQNGIPGTYGPGGYTPSDDARPSS